MNQDPDWDIKIELARAHGITPPSIDEVAVMCRHSIAQIKHRKAQEEIERKANEVSAGKFRDAIDAMKSTKSNDTNWGNGMGFFGQPYGASQEIKPFDAVAHFKKTNPIANQTNMARKSAYK